MNRTILTPIFILAGILGVLGVMAGTLFFDPVVRFIHTDTINPLGTLACLLFTVMGFGCCYLLLNLLCTYFVPRIHDAPGQQK
jgi:hypothetical protein